MTNEEKAKRYLECLVGDGSMEFVYGPIKTEVLQAAIDALECVNSSAFKDGYKKAIKDIEEKMYKKSFVEDNGMQKWNSGLWIRYTLFENTIEEVRE